MFVFSQSSGFVREVIIHLVRIFPDASLYTCFHGFVDVVMLQNSFHDFIFSCFIPACYFLLSSVYFCFPPSLSFSSYLVLWYSILQVFIRFRIILRLSVHQGTYFLLLFFFLVTVIWKVLQHDDCTDSEKDQSAAPDNFLLLSL
jgi:hypothetical protein